MYAQTVCTRQDNMLLKVRKRKLHVYSHTVLHDSCSTMTFTGELFIVCKPSLTHVVTGSNQSDCRIASRALTQTMANGIAVHAPSRSCFPVPI